MELKIPPARLNDRRYLLGRLDDLRRQYDTSGTFEGADANHFFTTAPVAGTDRAMRQRTASLSAHEARSGTDTFRVRPEMCDESVATIRLK